MYVHTPKNLIHEHLCLSWVTSDLCYQQRWMYLWPPEKPILYIGSELASHGKHQGCVCWTQVLHWAQHSPETPVLSLLFPLSSLKHTLQCRSPFADHCCSQVDKQEWKYTFKFQKFKCNLCVSISKPSANSSRIRAESDLTPGVCSSRSSGSASNFLRQNWSEQQLCLTGPAFNIHDSVNVFW